MPPITHVKSLSIIH